ncbi:NACHT domain-containing protein [Amycolatopsis deserti]|uniref:NACHT domain-containing protein n=1 Tax=Amycolatopsis deserti TaxID=185696 RepID=UPI00174AD219|nr:NACHT domain-containing protein [Amycolatopsis deserti]
MTEPTSLALIVAQAAVKAAAGSATTASLPALRKLLKKVRLDPKILRGFTAWQEAKIDKAQEEKIVKFVLSREFQGLLELVAYLEYHTSDRWLEERKKLRETFADEIARRVTLDDHTLHTVTESLWSLAHDSVRLEVDRVRKSGRSRRESNMYVQSLLAAHLFPDDTTLQRAVESRSTLASHYTDVTHARALAAQVREETHRSHSTIQMPHSRENFRPPVHRLYVHRKMLGAGSGAADRFSTEIPDHQVHEYERRVVVLGNPGAGKSTYIRYLTHWLSSDESGREPVTPFLVELKNFGKGGDDLVQMIGSRLRLLLQTEVDLKHIRTILTLGSATVVFDALDEAGDLTDRREAVEAIERFCRRYPLVQVVVTSRRQGYGSAQLDPSLFAAYILPDFNPAQIRNYVDSWFRFVAGPDAILPSARATAFLRDSEHIHELRSNPLMLSLLCLLYEYEGWIPENRLQVYKECANLMFVRWDRARRVNAKETTLGSTHIWFLFQELGYWFFTKDVTTAPTERAVHQVIERFLARELQDHVTADTSIEATDFLEFCAGRAWLLTRVGSTAKGERLFDFTHRTFMEYFAAEYLTRHSDSIDEFVATIWQLIQTGASYVVPQIAIQQFDINVANGLNRTMLGLLKLGSEAPGTLHPFVLDTLHYVQPSASTVETILLAALKHIAAHRDDDLATQLAQLPSRFSAVLEDLSLRELAKATASEDFAAAQFRGAVGFVIAANIPLPPDTSLRPFYSGHRGSRVLAPWRHLARSHPSTVYELYRGKVLDAEEFLAVAGRPALVRAPEFLLLDLLRAGEPADWLLDTIASHPDSLLPLPSPLVEQALPVLTDLAQARPTNLDDTAARRAGWYALFAAFSCAAFEQGRDWLPLFRAVITKLGHEAELAGMSRVQLGGLARVVGNDAGLRTRWADKLGEWQHGLISFGTADNQGR